MAIDVRGRNGVIIVTLSGRIIGPAGGELRQTLNEQLENIDSPKVLFDLGEVSRIDSSGLGTLVATQVTVARKGGRAGIVNIGEGIQNLLVMGRLITVFERYDSEEEAITGLTS